MRGYFLYLIINNSKIIENNSKNIWSVLLYFLSLLYQRQWSWRDKNFAKMKTYIVLTNKGMVAVQANNKNQAHQIVIDKGYKANKGSVTVSSVHYDYVQASTKI